MKTPTARSSSSIVAAIVVLAFAAVLSAVFSTPQAQPVSAPPMAAAGLVVVIDGSGKSIQPTNEQIAAAGAALKAARAPHPAPHLAPIDPAHPEYGYTAYNAASFSATAAIDSNGETQTICVPDH